MPSKLCANAKPRKRCAIHLAEDSWPPSENGSFRSVSECATLSWTKSATPRMWIKTLTRLHDYLGVHPQKTKRQAPSFPNLRSKSRVPMPSGPWADAKQSVVGCQVNRVLMPSPSRPIKRASSHTSRASKIKKSGLDFSPLIPFTQGTPTT